MMVGQGPVIVDRHTGQLFETGSAYPTEHYVKAYTACGNPLAEPTSYIQMSGWQKGANKVAVTGYIKHTTNFGLKDAKELVDKVLDDNVVSFQVSSPEKATEAVKIIGSYGFKCRQLWSNQC
jgi:ribosomal protein L7/L12